MKFGGITPQVGACSVDFGGTEEGILVGTSACEPKSTLASSFLEGDTQSIRRFSSGKFNEGSPPPMGEMLKGKEGIKTLLPLAQDIARKINGKLGVTPPEIVEERGELDTPHVSSTQGDPTGISKEGKVIGVDEGIVRRSRFSKTMSSSSSKWASLPS